MTADELKILFPKASDDFIRRNLASSAAQSVSAEPRAPDGVKPTKKRLRQQQGDGLNATERAFALFLDNEWPVAHARLAQSITLKLANGLRYTPDNIVVLDGLTIYAFEVKGFMRDDAAVKLKVAAKAYPWIKFHLVTKQKKKAGGGWDIQEILP